MRRARRPWPMLIGAGIMAVLTVLANPQARFYAIVFWLGLALLFWGWCALDETRKGRKRIADIDAAIRRNVAEVIQCQSDEVVAFEEIEDEGAEYCFQAEQATLLFVSGQDFYETSRFPNSDFEIITACGDMGVPRLWHLACHGKKLKPGRIIPAEQKKQLTMPEHLEVRTGRLEHLEKILSHSKA